MPDSKTTKRPFLILLAVSFGVLVAADDLTVVSTLLPQMIVDFQIPVPAGLNDAAWIVSAYLIAYIVTMPFMGRISDIYGRLKVYLLSLGLFVLGSVFVPLVDDLPLLIVFRAVQALGGGAMVPVAMAIIGDVFPRERRPMAMGVLVAIDTAGWIIGPIYGALLVRYLDWRWQFYINIPASMVAALAAVWMMRGIPQTRKKAPADLPGALLLAMGLTALNLAFTANGGASSGPSFDFDAPASSSSLIVWPWLAAAAASLFLFWYREKRTPHPLIDLDMLRRPNLVPAGAINFFIGCALIIAMVDVPLFVNTITSPAQGGTVDEVLQRAALSSGQVLALMTGAMSLASLLGGWLCSRWSYRLPTILGLLASAGGLFLMGTWSPSTTFWDMAPHLALAGLGIGLATSPLSTAVINAVDETHRGVASGLVVILRLIGMSVGLSVLTAWGLDRFEQLSAAYSITEIGAVISNLTARVLDETFWATAVIMAAGVLVAVRLVGERRT